MNLDTFKFSKLQIIITVVIAIGILVTLFLVQRSQIFKGKATTNVFDSFEVTDPAGSPLPKSDNAGTRVYQTNDLNVNIRIKDINGLTGD